MVGVSSSQGVGRRLRTWSPKLFLAAGLLLVVYATLHGVEAFTHVAYPAVRNVFGPAGFVCGFVGLFGLYPAVVDRSPKLAQGGAVAVALGAAGFSVIAVSNLGRVAGILPTEEPAWFPVLLGMVAAGMIPGYLAFATGCLRTDVHSRRIGVLLLAPAAIFAVMLTGGAMGFTPQWSAFLISAGQAVACLSIGYSLRTGRPTVEREIPSGDVTTG